MFENTDQKALLWRVLIQLWDNDQNHSMTRIFHHRITEMFQRKKSSFVIMSEKEDRLVITVTSLKYYYGQ